ncbi:unnamed protein product [Onchocerca flexuosa]|uniref:Transmembrane protein n=1 Tax=Onchocerca flexuosa TaxID=387005 RepID=A0A183HP22_9BILA|nr:unnamed protein product [Onchocerca flexuosa]
MEKVHNQRDSPLRWRGANGCGKLACGQMIGFYGRSVVQIVRLEMLGISYRNNQDIYGVWFMCSWFLNASHVLYICECVIV